MKPPAKVRPNITITVTGRRTRRMKVGLMVMKAGAWLVRNGGMKVDYS